MMCLTELGLDNGSWMDLAQNHFQWWDLILAVLNFEVLLPE
jgi:hypothetical protein